MRRWTKLVPDYNPRRFGTKLKKLKSLAGQLLMFGDDKSGDGSQKEDATSPKRKER